MFPRNHALQLMGLAALGLLTACGAGMEFHVEQPHWPGPVTPGPVTVFGKLDAPGEVTVQGVRFATDDAITTIDGIAARATDLRAGEILRLRGEVRDDGLTGIALRIDAESAVVGPVEAVDVENGRLVVAGQGVETDLDTVVGSNGLAGIPTGSFVRVCGWRDASGDVLATRIDTASDGEVRVAGSVWAHDVFRRTLRVGGLTLDYGAADLVGLPGGVPANGLRIVASGILVDGVLVAGEIRPALDPRDGEGRVLVEGIVTRRASETGFEMGGIPYTAGQDTWFNHGTRRDLAPEARVVVRGWCTAGMSSVPASFIEFARLP